MIMVIFEEQRHKEAEYCSSVSTFLWQKLEVRIKRNNWFLIPTVIWPFKEVSVRGEVSAGGGEELENALKAVSANCFLLSQIK